MLMQFQSILHFWFTELTPKQHFAKDAALDEAIRTRFGATLEAAARCELFAWRETSEGRLAEILVLDQFSRNVYLDSPLAFAHDALAMALPSIEDTLPFEQRHKDIIVRFGRSPYSNILLGRDSTPEELGFLSEPGSVFNPLSMASDSPMRYNMDLIAT